jgi:hypothetical protein
LRQTVAVFHYLFASPVAGIIMLAAFAAGVVLLCVGVGRPKDEKRRERGIGLLLVFPFIVNASAALFRFYPYGGTRHCLYLIVFAAAGVGLAVAWLFRRRLLPIVAASVVLVPLWSIFFRPPSQYIAPRDQRRVLMSEMVDYIRQTVPRGGIVFCDFQTQVLLRYYLCGARTLDSVPPAGKLREFVSRGFRLVYPDQLLLYWSFETERFGGAFGSMAENLGLARGGAVCVVDAGWGWNLADALNSIYKVTYPKLKRFGHQISVFEVPVGSEPGNARARRVLDSLAWSVRQQVGHVRSSFWPTDQFDDSTRSLARLTSDQAFSYGALYAKATPYDSSFERKLPALAFWVFGNQEFHLQPLDEMARHASYESGWYRFRLVGADPDTVAGVYLIESLKAKALGSMAKAIAKQSMSYIQSVFWPTDYLTDSIPGLLGDIGSRVISYQTLYRGIKGNPAGLKPYLPALAFWAFGTKEEHPTLMEHMNDAANYVSGGYRFMLLAVDGWKMGAVYQVEAVH